VKLGTGAAGVAQLGTPAAQPERNSPAADSSWTCYNRKVSSIRDRLRVAWLFGLRQANTRIPPIFVLGVVMIVVVTGGLLLRSQLAAGGVAGSAAASGPVASGTDLFAGAPPDGVTGTLPTGQVASTVSAQPTLGLTGYVWPLTDAVITLPFGPTDWGEFIVDGQKFHDGVDMATNCGDYVRAAHDGVILAASREYDAYMGWTSDIAPYYHLLDTKKWWNSLPIVVVIDDGDGYRSIYAHEYQVIVKPGDKVKAGQIIGYEGATGNASGCHVHFGLFKVSETATFQLDPAVVTRNLLPAYETARIDPLLVLPFRCEVEEMRALRPVEAAPCPVLATPVPSAKATTTKKPTASPSPTTSSSPKSSAKASLRTGPSATASPTKSS
jgi:murein DD-endopeptidase MepM/ murein hydrolase activator NlpD